MSKVRFSEPITSAIPSTQPTRLTPEGGVEVQCPLCDGWVGISTTAPHTVAAGFGRIQVDARRKSTYDRNATSVSRIGEPDTTRRMFPRSVTHPRVCSLCRDNKRKSVGALTTPATMGAPRLVKVKRYA